MSTIGNQVLQELENGGCRYESTKVKCQVLQPLICNEHCYDSDFPNTLLISLAVIYMYLKFHIWRYVHLSCQD